MLHIGAKASNMEFVKAFERTWTLSKPEHLGLVHRHEKFRVIGVTKSRQPFKTKDLDEGTCF
eukprot:12733434-Prorocentrum_lima.AAC.1